MGSSIRRVAVAGSGTMGLGIAHVSALGGFETVLYDVAPEQLQRARARIESNLQKGVDRGKLAPSARVEALGRLSTTTDLAEACAGSQAIIEAIPERIDLKLDFLREVVPEGQEHLIEDDGSSGLGVGEVAEDLVAHVHGGLLVAVADDCVQGILAGVAPCFPAVETSRGRR